MAVGTSNADITGAGLLTASRTGASRHRVNWRMLELWVPLGIFLFIAAACFLGPLVFTLPTPIHGNLAQSNMGMFSQGHVLGTDDLGNDLLSRSLYAGRISIEVGFGAIAIGVVVGGAIGTLAGYFGGLVDSLLMRILDVLLAFPALILALAIAAYLGPNERDVILAIAFFTVPANARIARSATLRIREQGFVLGAKLIGGRDAKIIVSHVVPNVVPTLLTFSVLGIAIAMLIEAGLSFLGLGVNPPTPTWGNMIANAEPQLSLHPYEVFVPATFLLVTILAVNLVGDALRARRASS